MEYILKTNNDLKYIIKKFGSKGLQEVVASNYIYNYNQDFYFTQSKYKVEINILILSIKILFKNKYFNEAIKLLSVKTYFVTKIKDIKKYSYQAFEYYFLGLSLKDLNSYSITFNNVIYLPKDLKLKIEKLSDKNEKLEVINLINKFIKTVNKLITNNNALSIYYNNSNNSNYIKLSNLIDIEIES